MKTYYKVQAFYKVAGMGRARWWEDTDLEFKTVQAARYWIEQSNGPKGHKVRFIKVVETVVK